MTAHPRLIAFIFAISLAATPALGGNRAWVEILKETRKLAVKYLEAAANKKKAIAIETGGSINEVKEKAYIEYNDAKRLLRKGLNKVEKAALNEVAADAKQRKLPNLYGEKYDEIYYYDYYDDKELIVETLDNIFVSESIDNIDNDVRLSMLFSSRFASRLNLFWAQEAIGAPEARALIRSMEQNKFTFREPRIGVIDGGVGEELFDGHPRFTDGLNKKLEKASSKQRSALIDKSDDPHATMTIGILVSESEAGVSSKGKISELLLGRSNPYRGLKKRLDEGHEIPPLYNQSRHFTAREISDPATEQVLDSTILVHAAGNDFPAPILGTPPEFLDKMIVVGSADPGGFPSAFSQTSDKVVVLAPSDTFQRSARNKGQFIEYGYTSGAAPMVSAVLSDTMSILPGLKRDEAVIMLQKTATRTSINSVSEVNGAGVLNHYKMLRVAQRLHAAGFNEADRAQRLALLKDEKHYDFAREATGLQAEADELLESADPDNYNAAFKKLRQAFFLDSGGRKTRTALAKIYDDGGHPASAQFYAVPVDLNQGTPADLDDIPIYIQNIYKKAEHRALLDTHYDTDNESFIALLRRFYLGFL